MSCTPGAPGFGIMPGLARESQTRPAIPSETQKEISRPNSTAERRSRQRAIHLRSRVALFNQRKFFEAHELWEEIWLHAKLPEKTFLQGLIQVTAAFHHHSRRNFRGMESLLRRGLTKLDEFPASHRGLKIGVLRTTLRKWLATLESGERVKQPHLPFLRALR
jgi:predicted metal-dependent hydrolase